MRITLKSLPMSINASYASGQGRFYKRGGAKEAQYLMAQELLVQYRELKAWGGNFALDITYYWPDRRRRDVDNGAKMTLDAMTGIVYEDDKQVTDLHLHKRIDKDNPRVEIEITKLEKEEKSSESEEKTAKVRALVKDIRAQS